MISRVVRLSVWLSMLFISLPALADGLIIRPQAGIGVLDGNRYEHVGVRLLSNVTGIRRYGLELTRLNSDGADYIAAGIVLEQRLYGWFNMSIGTIGYFGQGAGVANYPGMVANLGWEPQMAGAFKPFVSFRNDILFADKTLTGGALSAGFTFEF